MKYAKTKDGMEYHLYKVKFSNGERVRNELFAELKGLLDRMRDLLDTSDKETQLIRDRASAAKSSSISMAICGFWIHANKLFHALASAWNCYCQQQHCARLLLQHRTCTSRKLDFEVLFAKSLASSWEISQTRIVEGDDLAGLPAGTLMESVQAPAMRTPSHREKQPIKSALRTTRLISATDVGS